MPSVERTFDVDAPLDKVFDYLADFTNTEHWDPGTVSTTRLDTSPLSVGARFRNVSDFLGRRTELEYTLRELDHGKHLVFVGVNKTATATDDLTFTGSALRTKITYRAKFEFRGFAKLVGPILRPSLERLADKTVAQLKETLEHI
jgi:carbon monoxide dehydrogenase subunit G